MRHYGYSTAIVHDGKESPGAFAVSYQRRGIARDFAETWFN